MILTKDEKYIVIKYREIKKYAQGLGQSELNIKIPPGSKTPIVAVVLQEKIEIEERNTN